MSETRVFEVPAGPAPTWVPSVEEVDVGVDPELVAYEIVDGQVLPKVSTTFGHSHVVQELSVDVGVWARAHGAWVVTQTFDVRTTRTRRRQPDLLLVLAEHRDRVGPKGMLAAPDLAVEVLSDSRRSVDLADKREEYAAIGVREHWVVDLLHDEARIASPPTAPWRTVRRGEDLTSPLLPGLAVPLDRILPPPTPAP